MTRQTVSRWALLIGALVLTMVLAGCGGDDGVSESVHQQTQDELAAQQAETARLGRIAAARTAIAAAATAADAQAAYDAVKDEATDAESAALMQAVSDRTAAIATMEENQRLEMERQAETARLGRIAAARTAIAAAATAADAQAAYDMVKDEATDTESAELMQAVANRTAAIAAAEENQRLEMERQAEMARMARIEDALDDIEMAETAEDVDAAYDAVKDEATDTEDAALMQAVADRKAELATMTRAEAIR